jgi:hypothetical protein
MILHGIYRKGVYENLHGEKGSKYRGPDLNSTTATVNQTDAFNLPDYPIKCVLSQ